MIIVLADQNIKISEIKIDKENEKFLYQTNSFKRPGYNDYVSAIDNNGLYFCLGFSNGRITY